MQGRAKTVNADSHMIAMSNAEVLTHWKMLKARAELAVMRIEWLQSACQWAPDIRRIWATRS
eukprot:7055122-Pyramimonas_sp.AAC.1